jgi:hypothetical protein
VPGFQGTTFVHLARHGKAINHAEREEPREGFPSVIGVWRN